MKRFMKGCAVTAIGFAVVGFVLSLVGGSMAGRNTISQVVDSVTGGKVSVFQFKRYWWDWWMENNQPVDQGITETYLSEQVEDEITTLYEQDEMAEFDHRYGILEGYVAKYCPGDRIRNLDIQVGGCQLTTAPSQDDSIYLEVMDAYRFQGYVDEGTLYIKSTMGSVMNWAETGKCDIILYLPEDYHFQEVEAEIGAGNMFLDKLSAEEVSLTAGAGEITLDAPDIQELNLAIGAGSIELWSMRVAELEAEVGMGNFYAEGVLDGDADVECSMGSVDMVLTGRERDFNYNVTGSMGNIDIGGKSFIGLGQETSVDNDAGKTISIECSMGYVSVEFTQ